MFTKFRSALICAMALVSTMAIALEPLRSLPLATSALPAAIQQDAEATGESATFTNRGSLVLNTSITGPTAPVLPSSSVVYNVTISNTETFGTTSPITFLLTASTGPSFQAASFPGGSCTGGLPLSCTISGGIPASATISGTVTLQMPSAATITPPSQNILITARTDSFSPGTPAMINTTVTVAQDFSVSGSVAPNTVAVGEDLTFTLLASNAGPLFDVWSGATVQLQLPPSVQFQSASAGNFNCSAGGGTVTCTALNGATGATQSLQIVARALAAASQASATPSVSSPRDPNTSNNIGAPIAFSITQPRATFTIEKSAPREVGVEEIFDYVIRIDNTSSTNGSGTLEDPLPAGLEFIGTQGAACTLSGRTVRCPITVAGGQSLLVRIGVRAPADAAELINTATLLLGKDPSIQSTAVTTVRPRAASVDLAVTKSVDLAQASVGSRLRYTVIASNIGSSAANNVVVTDDLPGGLRIISAPDFAIAGNQLRAEIATLGAGEQRNLTIEVEILAGAASTLVNQVRIAGANPEDVLGNNSASAVTAVSGANSNADLSVRAQLLSTAGQPFRFSVEVSNQGPSATPPTTLSGQSSTPQLGFALTGGDCQSGSCQIPSLAVGQTLVFSGTAEPSPAFTSGILTFVVAVPSGIIDPVPSNNTATLALSSGPAPTADLSISATLTPTTYRAVGDTLDFTFTVRNAGPATIPANSLVSATPSMGAGLSLSGLPCQITVCQLPELAAGASVSGTGRLTVVNDVPSISLRLQALGNGAISDSVPGNNTVDLLATRVQADSADLALTATTTATSTNLGESLPVTLRVRNFGPSIAAAVRVSATLPANLVLDSSTGGLACAVSGSQLNCTASNLAVAEITQQLSLRTQNTATTVALTFLATSATPDSNQANNSAQLQFAVGLPTNSDVIEDLLQPVTDVFARDAIPTVADICANPPADLRAQCESIIRAQLNGDVATATRGLRAIYPEEVLSQALSATQLAATQFTNVDARLTELRGGGGGFTVSGLNVKVDGQLIPLSLFKGIGAAEGDDREPQIDGGLIKHWGGFLNGTVAFGDQDVNSQLRNTVSDFTSYTITAGVDYRKSATWVLGGAIGYNDFSSDLADDGKLSTRGYTLTAYTSFYPRDLVYIDGRISYGRMTFDLDRRIFVPGVVDRTAKGSTDGDQLSVASSVGYHINRGGWTVTPSLSLRHSRTSYDAFVETGAGSNNFSYDNNDSDSTQIALGLSASRAISLSNGVLLPQFDLSFNREMQSQDIAIDASLLGISNANFRVRTTDNDQSFGNVGLGFVFVMANGRQIYLSYRELFGAEGLSRGSVNFGGRFEF